MKIYNYSEQNGEFLSESQALANPVRHGDYLIPRNATTKQPPEAGAQQVAQFKSGQWQLVPDYRGGKWYTERGEEKTIKEINQEPDPTWLTEKPVLPVPVPQVVSMRQARLALLKRGYLSQVEPIINQLPEEQKQAALIEWEFAGTVDRDEALTRVLVAGLNLTEQQENELFELAATL